MNTNANDMAAVVPIPAALPKMNPTVKVIGIGSAGANIVEEVIRGGLENAAFAVFSTDQQTLANSSSQKEACLERKPTDQSLPKLDKLFEGIGTVFVVAGLGGRTGTELSVVVAKAAKEAGALSLAFVPLPFDCEGSLRRQKAEAGLSRLRAAADCVFCLPNQRTVPLIHEETSLVDTYKVANQLLTGCLRGVYRALTSTAVIGLPFSDLCALLREQCAENTFAAAEADGPNRARNVVEKLLAHPLLDGGRFLPKAQAVFVSVVGGQDLTTAEVNRVMEQINARCQGAPVVMGAGVHASLKGSLTVVLVVAGSSEAVQAEDGLGASSQTSSLGAARGEAPELDTQLLTRTGTARPSPRFVPPPPVLTSEQREQLIAKQTGASARQRKNAPRMRQTQLPLEIVSKGRFDKSEPTIHKGEDLDVPTFIRRGVVLN